MIGPDLNKWDARWGEGVFLGIRAISNEVYVGTPEGVIKCRAIRRRVIDQRWNLDLFNRVRGVPWDMGAKALTEPSAEEQLKPLPSAEHVQQPSIANREKHNHRWSACVGPS